MAGEAGGTPLSRRAGYSHVAMVDLMIAHPEYTHGQLCAHFGRPSSWLASVLASEVFQSVLDERRHLVLDPTLTATLQERFKALAIRTSNVLMDKMDNPEVSDFLVIKSAEASVKALGMGQKHTDLPQANTAAVPEKSVAERILEAMDRREARNTVEATVVEVKS